MGQPGYWSGELAPWGVMNEHHQGVYTVCCCLPSGSSQRREGAKAARQAEGRKGRGGGASGTAQNLLSGATMGNILLSETLVPRAPTTDSSSLSLPATPKHPPQPHPLEHPYPLTPSTFKPQDA